MQSWFQIWRDWRRRDAGGTASRRSPRHRPLGWMILWTALAICSPGCAPAIQDGASLAVPPVLAASSHVRSLSLSSGWLQTGEGFAETFSEEVLEELRSCARGPDPLELRIHVRHMDRAERLEALVNREAAHRLTAMVELVDPADHQRIVGRYPIELSVDAGDSIEGLLGDREMMIGKAFGRALCAAAFTPALDAEPSGL